MLAALVQLDRGDRRQPLAFLRPGEQLVDRVRKRFRVAGRHVAPRPAVQVCKLYTGAQACRHYRFAAHVGLQYGDPERLAPGHRRKHKHRTGVQVIHQGRLRQFPREMDRHPELGREPPAARPLGPVARDDDGTANPGRRAHQKLETLIVPVPAREQYEIAPVLLTKPAHIRPVGTLELFRNNAERHHRALTGKVAQRGRGSDILLGGRQNHSSFPQKVHLNRAVHPHGGRLAHHVAVVSDDERPGRPGQQIRHFGRRVRHMHHNDIRPLSAQVPGEQGGDRRALEPAPFSHLSHPGAVPLDNPASERPAARERFDIRPLLLVPAAQRDVPFHPPANRRVKVFVYMQDLHGFPMSRQVWR